MADIIKLIWTVVVLLIWIHAIVRAQKVFAFDRSLGLFPIYVWFFMRGMFWTVSMVIVLMLAGLAFEADNNADPLDPGSQNTTPELG